ncbi:MAG: SCO1664 family protein [Chloroflexota bacterium]
MTWQADVPVGTDAALAALRDGAITVRGRIAEASNATLLCRLRSPEPLADGTRTLHAVYKPIRGERPLADFPDGTLAGRELAAWELSEALGWSIVPPTILRDGPHGPGALQLWIETDPDADVLLMILARDPRLRRIALFDLVANNADRKGGHLLPVDGARVHGCDHGICFSVEPKLRTVLWAWQGEPLTDAERADLGRVGAELGGSLGERLRDALAAEEIAATGARIAALLAEGRFPAPDTDRRVYPWPLF